MSTSNRLIKEFSDMKKEKDLNFKIFPDENNLHKWNGVLNGPSGTPYQVSIKLKCCKEE
jgi:ubiquitin-protein ligase